MRLWSKERLLRGAAEPRSACAIATCGGLLTAIAFSATAPHPLDATTWLGVFGMAVAFGALALAAYVDVVRQILPDPLLLAALMASCLHALSRGTDHARSALAVGLCAAGIGYAVAAVSSLGRGDAKLCGVIGLWIGAPREVVAALVGGIALAGIHSIVMTLTGRMTPSTSIALGPWLVCAAWGVAYAATA